VRKTLFLQTRESQHLRQRDSDGQNEHAHRERLCAPERQIVTSIAGGSIASKSSQVAAEKPRDELTDADREQRFFEIYNKLSNKMKKTARDGRKRVKARLRAKLADDQK
jgi:hypothetical protein